MNAVSSRQPEGRPLGVVARLGAEWSNASDRAWRLRRHARAKAHGWSPVAKVVLLVAVALLASTVFYHVLRYVIPLPVWAGTEKACNDHKLSCDLTTHLLGDSFLALAGLIVFLSRQSRTSTLWRRRAMREPHALFTWVSPIEGGLTDIAAETVSQTRRIRLPRRLRRAAKQAGLPTGLRFRWGRRSALVDSILGRDDLVEGIADDLETGYDPQVIVGESAAGKTMVLIKLADRLARRRKVPIPISLQGASEIDFAAQARTAYTLSSPGVAAEEVEKRWAALIHRGQVVVLADDLEKAAKPHQVEAALQQASRQKLRLVVASRPYGLPAGAMQRRIDLEPLREEDVRKDLVRVARSASGRKPDRVATEEMVKGFVDRAGITVTLYYLSLARVLAKRGLLISPPEHEDARLWLLRTYCRALAQGRIREDAGLRQGQRERVLRDLRTIAFARVLGNRKPDAISAKLAELGYSNVDVTEVVGHAQRLGVLGSRQDERVRFAHPTTMAFFASRFLLDQGRPEDEWKLLLDEEPAPYRLLTLVFATIEGASPEHTEEVCTRLLEQAQREADKSGSEIRAGTTWLAAAAEIARHGKAVNRQTATAVARGIKRELEASQKPGRDQVGLLRALGELTWKTDIPDPYDVLWSQAMTSRDYRFSRQATKELSASRSPVEALLPKITEMMESAKDFEAELTELAIEDRDQEPFVSLRAVAWILPSLRSVIYARIRDEDDEVTRERMWEQKELLDGYQEDLIRYARTLTLQRGLEAAVAQGIKFDAVRDEDLPPDSYALALLSGEPAYPDFWFSRVLLVQALARRANADKTGEARRLVTTALRDEHVFVRHTAKLALQALSSDEPERFLFEDLTEVVSGAPYGLAREASQLIGDIVLALNLNEYGNEKSRMAFGKLAQAPACLTRSRSRHEVLRTNQPPLTCPFRTFQKDGECLCPYTYEPPSQPRGEGDAVVVVNRREISRAFCRHQRLNARSVPWSSGMRTKHVREFWTRMEELARF